MAEVSAQLSGRDSMVGDAEGFDQFLFNTGIRADILNIIAKFLQPGD